MFIKLIAFLYAQVTIWLVSVIRRKADPMSMV